MLYEPLAVSHVRSSLLATSMLYINIILLYDFKHRDIEKCVSMCLLMNISPSGSGISMSKWAEAVKPAST